MTEKLMSWDAVTFSFLSKILFSSEGVGVDLLAYQIDDPIQHCSTAAADLHETQQADE